MGTIVLVRHGESLWNREQRFTGWTDIELTPLGVKQAKHAGKAIVDAGLGFDAVVTSSLRRASDSQEHILAMMPTAERLRCIVDWRLNERHYGGLTGMGRAEAEIIYGTATVHRWRRDYTSRPPPMNAAQARRLVGKLSASSRNEVPFIPRTESLQDTFHRVAPCWRDTITPLLRVGGCVLVSAHGNSLRMLIAAIHGTDPAAFCSMDVPNATPLVYRLDSKLRIRNVLELPTGADGRTSLIL